MLVIVADSLRHRSLRHRSGILRRGTTSSEKPNLVEFKKNQIWLNLKKTNFG